MEKIEELKLDEILEKLEDTVEKLENNDIDFDSAVKLYEYGAKLAKRAEFLLDGYKKRITVLKKENGEICEEDWKFEDNE